MKRSAVRELIEKENVGFICLQETKLEYVDERLACKLWGNNECSWAYSGSIGTDGGLCCIWDSKVFVKEEIWGEKGMLGVSGTWEGCPVNIVNVYMPCKSEEKREVWELLEARVKGREDDKWCICGDFNAVRNENERRGLTNGGRRKEMRDFNELINKLRLVDLPLERRKFTWYKDNGRSCSRLDRFLISLDWIVKWPNLTQVGLKRKVSDHAALLLKEEVEDWGPKPLKFLSWCLKEKGFKELVEEEWKNHKVEGWSGFIIKEKLKHVKEKTKKWHKEHYGNLDGRIEGLSTRVQELDNELEAGRIDETLMAERKKTWADLNKCLELKDHTKFQQAKNKWINEGDANSKFFHRCVERKGRWRRLKGLRVNKKWVEGVQDVEDSIRSHFEAQFAARPKQYSRLPAAFSGRKISISQATDLEAPFSKSEIKNAIWACGLIRSPGLDGFNFLFYRAF